MARISNLNSFSGNNLDEYFIPVDSASNGTYRYPGSRIRPAHVEAVTWITKVALNPGAILFQKDMTSLAPSTSLPASVSNRTHNTAAFYPFGGIYYYDSAIGIGANQSIPANTLKSEGIVDLRDAFNIPSSWTANNPVYVRCESSGSTDGKVKFNIAYESWSKEVVLVQSLPSTQDSYYYIYLGQTINNSGSMYLTPWHPVYVYRGGSVRIYGQYAGFANTAANDGNGNEIASSYMPFKGQFTGTIDATDIAPGIYYLDAYSITINGTATFYYGTFIQFPGTYKAQAIFASPVASNTPFGGMLTRRYYTSTTSWSDWLYMLRPALPITGGEVTGQVRLNSNEVAPLRIKHSFDAGTNPSAAEYRSIYVTDKATSGTAVVLASFNTQVDTSGNSKVDIFAANNKTSGATNSGIRITQNYDGSGKVQARIAGTDYDVWHKGNMPVTQLSPTAATISGVTVNRSYFYRMGPFVFCQANITLASETTVSSNTNLFTGLPAAVGTTDMPFVYTGSNANRSVYINSSGQLKASGSITAGNWVFNGWYYTTAS